MTRTVGSVCLVAAVLLLALPAVLAPADAMATDADAAFAPPSPSHPFGTDSVGRDVAARVLAGATHTLSVVAVALVLSSLLGTAIGTVAGLSGGPLDRVLTAGSDLLIAFPQFVVLLNVAALFDLGAAWSLGALIGVISWMGTARYVRTEVLSLRERAFVEAARAAGGALPRLIVRHLSPHLGRLVLERIGLRFAGTVLLASSFDYLGLGLAADRPSWGGLIRDGQHHLAAAPWIALSAVTVLSLITVGFVLALDRLPWTAARRGVERPSRPGAAS